MQKLDIKDLQFEKMNPFDGTMAYAQNKRQQVVMTEKWAEKHKEIFFSSMHPGKNTHLKWNRVIILLRAKFKSSVSFHLRDVLK